MTITINHKPVEHKRIYALTLRMTPGEHVKWTNPKSQITHTWTVPDDGQVLFYIGETSMTVSQRHSKHRTFAKKLITHLQGIPTIDPHDYPVYYFTKEFCGVEGREFEAHELQNGEGMTEAEWVSFSKELGHPIQNSASGSYSTKVGGRKDDGSVNSEFRKVNEANMGKKPKKHEPTEEEWHQARLDWIKANRERS